MLTKFTIKDIYEIAKNRNGKCLSKEYVNSKRKLKWQCSNGHIWLATFDSIKRNSWCPFCAGKKKLTIKEMHIIAKKKDGKCLSKKYINSKRKLKWQCSNGHIWWAIPVNIKQGTWCPKCGDKRKGNYSKFTIKTMNEMAKKKDGKCLSKKYVNTKTKQEWQCSKGHIWRAIPSSIKRGYWCPSCAKNRKLKIEDMYEIAKKKDGKCLSNNYINNKTKLRWGCSKNHTWEATPDDIKQGTWCPICARNMKLKIEDMYKFAKKKGGKCLSKIYINTETKLQWECNEGHNWWARPNNIRNGKWCPQCKTGVSERICITFFEKLFKQKFQYQKTFPWLKGVLGNNKGRGLLRLDGYSSNLEINKEKIKLAVEYNGIQHYKQISLMSEKQFLQLQDNDLIKKTETPKHGIILIIIPYTVSYDKMKDYILSKLKVHRITPPNITHDLDYKKWDIYSHSYLNDCKNIAKRKGGECLSNKYINARTNLYWRCSKGHIWQATPDNIKRGSWCPKCARKK